MSKPLQAPSLLLEGPGADSVVVRVFLARVGIVQAVVFLADFVPVDVEVGRARVADVAEEISIRVQLVGVGIVRAVVREIHRAVAVGVGERRGENGAGVSDRLELATELATAAFVVEVPAIQRRGHGEGAEVGQVGE